MADGQSCAPTDSDNHHQHALSPLDTLNKRDSRYNTRYLTPYQRIMPGQKIVAHSINLPIEIITCICSHISGRFRTRILRKIQSLSRSLYNVVTPMIYATFVIRSTEQFLKLVHTLDEAPRVLQISPSDLFASDTKSDSTPNFYERSDFHLDWQRRTEIALQSLDVQRAKLVEKRNTLKILPLIRTINFSHTPSTSILNLVHHRMTTTTASLFENVDTIEMTLHIDHNGKRFVYTGSYMCGRCNGNCTLTSKQCENRPTYMSTMWALARPRRLVLYGRHENCSTEEDRFEEHDSELAVSDPTNLAIVDGLISKWCSPKTLVYKNAHILVIPAPSGHQLEIDYVDNCGCQTAADDPSGEYTACCQRDILDEFPLNFECISYLSLQRFLVIRSDILRIIDADDRNGSSTTWTVFMEENVRRPFLEVFEDTIVRSIKKRRPTQTMFCYRLDDNGRSTLDCLRVIRK